MEQVLVTVYEMGSGLVGWGRGRVGARVRVGVAIGVEVDGGGAT